jgi:hypothetical protein
LKETLLKSHGLNAFDGENEAVLSAHLCRTAAEYNPHHVGSLLGNKKRVIVREVESKREEVEGKVDPTATTSVVKQSCKLQV